MPDHSIVMSQAFHDTCLSFLSIVMEGTPFLFLSAVVSGLVAAFVPPDVWTRWIPTSKTGQMGTGIVAGFFMPMCECGAVAVVRRMLRQGVPRTVAMTYLFASPILNPFCILSTYYAFRAQKPWLMVGSRLSLGLMVILFLVWRLSSRRPEDFMQASLLADGGRQGHDHKTEHHSNDHESCCGHDHGHSHEHHDHPQEEEHGHHHGHGHDHGTGSPAYLRFLHAVSEDFIGVLTFLVIGAAFAACLNTFLPRAILTGLGGHVFFGPIVGIFLAQILCLCSTTDAFVIAAFPAFSFAAKLAFLVAGPLFDLKLVWMYQVIFQRRVVFWLWFHITLGTLMLVYLWRPL